MIISRRRLLAVGIAIPASLLWGLALARAAPFAPDRSIPVWCLAILFLFTERWPLVVAERREAPVIGLSAAPLVLGLIFCPPWAVLVAFLAGTTVAAATRRDLLRSATVVAIVQPILVLALAVLAFRAVVDTQATHDMGWLTYVGVGAAAAVIIVASVATWLAQAVLAGRAGGRPLVGNAGLALIGVGGAAGYGLLMADLAWSGSRSVAVATVLGVLLVGAYRALLVERRERRVAEFLRGTEEALHRPGELETAIVGLITRAREMFDAQVAQLTIYPSNPGEKAYRTTVRLGDPRGAEVMVPIAITELDDILEADSDGVIMHRDQASPDSRGVLERRGVDQAMVALLRGQTRMVGSLMVGNQSSNRGFDQRDLQLFQTLVIQTSATLENGRLEHSIARLTELQEQLSHQAFHDSLTDLANRALFSDRIDHALLRRTRTLTPIAVLFIDLDDFKAVNDTLGHAAGDQLLIGVAERLRTCLRRPDTAARLGGDEFAVLIEDINSVEEAELVADRITAALREPFTVSTNRVVMFASIGVAISDGDGDNAVRLMRQADVAMYAAKAAGKRRRVRFVAGMEADIVARHRLKADLEHAVIADEFDVHYQPIFDLHDGRLVATEALVRWRHPTRGMVAPDEFIRVAEETGVILQLGQSVLRKATAATLRWQARHPSVEPLWVSVNISARQLQQPLFVEEVLDIVRGAGLRPTAVVLELTESMVLEDAASSIAKLEALKRAGIRVAIDDFGTGYSSLSYLRRLPVDILKIAKPFVDDLDESRDDDGDFARAIVGIGNALRLSMIAEGIESVEQLQALRDLGCHLGQGYYLSHPLPAAELDELLAQGPLTADRLGLATSRAGSIVQLPAAR